MRMSRKVQPRLTHDGLSFVEDLDAHPLYCKSYPRPSSAGRGQLPEVLNGRFAVARGCYAQPWLSMTPRREPRGASGRRREGPKSGGAATRRVHSTWHGRCPPRGLEALRSPPGTGSDNNGRLAYLAGLLSCANAPYRACRGAGVGRERLAVVPKQRQIGRLAGRPAVYVEPARRRQRRPAPAMVPAIHVL